MNDQVRVKDDRLKLVNFLASVRRKADELAREAQRFECWLKEADEVEADARFLELRSEELKSRAEKLRDWIKGKK